MSKIGGVETAFPTVPAYLNTVYSTQYRSTYFFHMPAAIRYSVIRRLHSRRLRVRTSTKAIRRRSRLKRLTLPDVRRTSSRVEKVTQVRRFNYASDVFISNVPYRRATAAARKRRYVTTGQNNNYVMSAAVGRRRRRRRLATTVRPVRRASRRFKRTSTDHRVPRDDALSLCVQTRDAMSPSLGYKI